MCFIVKKSYVEGSMLAAVFSFLLCFIFIFLMKPVAYRVGLVDKPNHRKKHVGTIPLIGGISVFVSAGIGAVLFLPLLPHIKFYLLTALTLLVLGTLDDKYELSVKGRLLVQVILSVAMVYTTDLAISDLGNLFGFGNVNLGWFSVVLTCIAVIAAINAFNMIDGIDGLVGVLSLISFGFIGWFLYSSSNQWYVLSTLFMASLIAFLAFNLRWPFRKVNKVFMGDAGSMVIGFSIVWLLIVGSQTEVKAFSPVLCLFFIAIPLMDMAAIMYRRIKKGSSPFKPDREHLHHIFERAGYSRKQSLVYIALVAIVIAFVGVFLDASGASESLMLLVFIVIFLAYNYALIHVWRIVAWVRKHRGQ